MHTSHACDKLRSSQNHATTPEHVVDQVQNDEDEMRIIAISPSDELERCVSILDFNQR